MSVATEELGLVLLEVVLLGLVLDVVVSAGCVVVLVLAVELGVVEDDVLGLVGVDE